MSKKAIVYTIDDNTDCLLQLVTSLKSVRVFQPENYDVYILTNKPRSYLTNLYGAKVVDVSKLVDEYDLDNTGIIWRKHLVSPMLLFRLLIPIVPDLQGYDQILYLDTDTEVWNTKFFTIFSKDYNCDIIGVRDSLNRIGVSHRLRSLREKGPEGWQDPPGIFNRWDELIQRRGKYANSGVLVFNIKNIREGYENRIRYVIDKVKELKPYYSDQDSLNVYFRIYVVDDRRYNNWGIFALGTFLYHYVGAERKTCKMYPPIKLGRPVRQLCQDINTSSQENKNNIGPIYILRSPEDNFLTSKLYKWMLNSNICTSKFIPPPALPILQTLNTPQIFADTSRILHHYVALKKAISDGWDHVIILESSFNPHFKITELDKLAERMYDLALFTLETSFTKAKSISKLPLEGYSISKKYMLYLCKQIEEKWINPQTGFRLRDVKNWFASDKLYRLVISNT